MPPEMLLLGAKQSHDVKCLALGHAERSVPHSLTSLSARYDPSPLICVRSEPRMAWSAARMSNPRAFGCWVILYRGAGSSPLAYCQPPSVASGRLRSAHRILQLSFDR